MTPEQAAEIRDMHHPQEESEPGDDDQLVHFEVCPWDGEDWPCAVGVALEALEAEHAQRVTLVNAMWELLPKIVASDNPHWCVACRRPLLKWGHTDDCAYIAALKAVVEGGMSVEG